MAYTPDENKERQEALYRFLLSRGDKWTLQQVATSTVPMYPAVLSKYYHGSTASRLISKDIQDINASHDYECIIISGNNGIKLATEAEYEIFVKSEIKEIFAKLKRVREIMKKGSRNMQLDLAGEITQAFLEADHG